MDDPTAISIDFDPTVQRMKGVTVHGAMAFDVPYISEIAPNLWQGGCQQGLLLPRTIQHLVSLYPWEGYRVAHELDSVLVVRMYDSEDQTFEQIEEIARWVNLCRTTGPVLVHCQAGLNRSSLVAARALMLDGMTAEDRAGEAVTSLLVQPRVRGLPADLRGHRPGPAQGKRVTLIRSRTAEDDRRPSWPAGTGLSCGIPASGPPQRRAAGGR